MDNLTHSLVGAAIGKAGAERLTPLATATLVVAANAPDIDMVSFVRGEYFALAFRRGITHGWPALLVLPFVVTGAIVAWDRWVRRRRDPGAPPADPRRILALAAAGLLTHPSLDWLNIYGMRWGLPFDGAWSYGDSLFIIDPWIWLVLGGAVFLASEPGRRGLVGWATLAALATVLVTVGMGGWPAVVWWAGLAVLAVVRSRRREVGVGDGRGLVRGAVAAVAVYVAAMVASDAAARGDVRRAAEAAGTTVVDVLVAPSRGIPFRSELEVLTPDAYIPGTHDWLASPRTRLRPDEAVPLRSIPPELDVAMAVGIIEEARGRERVANYMVWARFPYVRVTPEGDGWAVRFGDARYDSQPEAAGLAGVTVHVTAPSGGKRP